MDWYWYIERKKRREEEKNRGTCSFSGGLLWLKEEGEGKREGQRYFVSTAYGVKGHVCQLCRLVLARVLCQQELYRVDAFLSRCQPV